MGQNRPAWDVVVRALCLSLSPTLHFDGVIELLDARLQDGADAASEPLTMRRSKRSARKARHLRASCDDHGGVSSPSEVVGQLARLGEEAGC